MPGVVKWSQVGGISGPIKPKGMIQMLKVIMGHKGTGKTKDIIDLVKKAAEEEFYASLQVGQKFTGTVRALMAYGAFVNIGPVDGMVHISELSWGKLRKPSDVLTIGQKLDVFVKGYDPETKRISLGYKTPENDPWKLFTEKFSIGDVCEVKVVSLMPFGAFAEILPELDGLIHNSQIVNPETGKTVSNPGEVLKVGDTVTAKLVGIDLEAKRINLSIKALTEPETPVEEAPAEEAAEAPAETPAEDAPAAE